MINWYYTGGFIFLLAILGILSTGIRIVRPNMRGAIERLGKYKGAAKEGFNLIIPLIDRMVYQEVTERMMDVDSFEAITKERLNTQINLVVFYKVKDDDDSVYKSLYKVRDFESQVVRIAQTTARNIIGKMPFQDVNSERGLLNNELRKTLETQGKNWGVEIVRVETKEITPPQNVQESMNKVLMAENEKTAAINTATAKETEADGFKRAKIKEAEGEKQAQILKAEGASTAFNKINSSFKGNAQKLKQLEVVQESMKNNSKIILGSDSKNLLKLFDIGK